MHLKNTVVGFLFTFLVSTASFAQEVTDCEQILNQASDEFTAGHFYGLSAILKDCLNKFTKEQSVRAYLLLTQAYLIVDDPIAAEDSYLKLLKADPEYVASEDKDPIDVVYLSKKFTATPIFTPHARLGTNTSIYRLIHEENPFSSTSNTRHTLRMGIQFGAGMDWNINDHWSLCGDLLYSYKAFKITRNGIFSTDHQTELEKQNWVDIPVYLKYSDFEGRIRPYGYAGYAVNLLLSAKSQLNLTNVIAEYDDQLGLSPKQQPTSGADIKIGYKRNLFNRSLVLGGGIRYKSGTDFFLVDVRYMAGMTNLTNEGNNHYDEPNTQTDYPLSISTTKYASIGDLFRLDNVSLSVGYVHPIYDPRKLKKTRSKAVVRKVSKRQKKEKK